MPDVTLSALDGSNPLGFLAALGVLTGIADSSPGACLKWHHEGAWRPILSSEFPAIEDVAECLDADRRRCIGARVLALSYDNKRDLKPPPPGFRDYLLELSTEITAADRRSVDWACAFATDVAVDNNGNTKPTALHFTAGQQQFLQMAGELADGVTREDLREAVEGPWKYQRPLPVMGWDATVSRDYALRASDPSTDKKLGVPGADWLALRGLIFLPTVPQGNRVMTTGCGGGWKNGWFRWPLWTVPLTSAVIRSALRQPWDEIAIPERDARGVAAVFISGIKRSDQGGYGSFEPASVV